MGTTWLSAQETTNFNAPIQSVIIYVDGAQVKRTGRFSIPKGKTTLVVDSLSPHIFEESIQVKAPEGVYIEAVNHQLDYLAELPLSEEVNLLRQRQKTIIDSIELLRQFDKLYNQEQEMLMANQSIGGDQGVSLEELEKTTNFYRQRLRDITERKYHNERQMEALQLSLMTIGKELMERNVAQKKPSGKIKVTIYADNPINAAFDLQYVVGEAGWSPVYDIRVAEVDQPLNLVYKAEVFQNSGQDWENVNLTLSTGNPFLSSTKPNLEPYYLNFNNYYRPSREETEVGGSLAKGEITGQILDDNGEPLIGASVMVPGSSTGTVTDMDGRFTLPANVQGQRVVISYTGFKTVEKIMYGSNQNIVLGNAGVLDELVVTDLAGQSSGMAMRSSKKKVRPKKAEKPMIPVSIQKQQTTTEFAIENPYDIPSDGEAYSVAIASYDIEPVYQFEAVPKLSNKAFLIAKLKNWVDYRLLDGQMNIFFKGVFQGQSQLNLSTVEEELTLSIGKDEDIIIEREIGKDYSSSAFLGNNRKVTKSWITTIKNNKRAPIQILIEDQYPISQNNSISVQIDNVSNGIVDEDTGKIKWTLPIPAQGSQQLETRYTVKYPRGSRLYVE